MSVQSESLVTRQNKNQASRWMYDSIVSAKQSIDFFEMQWPAAKLAGPAISKKSGKTSTTRPSIQILVFPYSECRVQWTHFVSSGADCTRPQVCWYPLSRESHSLVDTEVSLPVVRTLGCSRVFGFHGFVGPPGGTEDGRRPAFSTPPIFSQQWFCVQHRFDVGSLLHWLLLWQIPARGYPCCVLLP